jgi:hypothetical protein
MGSPYFVINNVPVGWHTPDDGTGAISEQFGPQGPFATWVIKCDWNSRWSVVKGLLGTNILSGSTTVRTPPMQYPDSAKFGGTLWVCTSVSDIQGQSIQVDQTTGMPYYDDAIITANFSVPDYDTVGTTDLSAVSYNTTRIRTSTEVYQTAAQTFYFPIVPATPTKYPLNNSSVGLLRSRAEIEVVRHLVAYPFLDLCMQLSGHINSTPMIWADKSYGVGSVLFLMGEIVPTVDPATGSRLFDVTLRFIANGRDRTISNTISDLDWNFFFFYDKAINQTGWSIVSTVPVPPATPFTPYAYINLVPLLTAG